MNPANRREALTEVLLDDAEGADILMVKPAGLYLDIIRDVREATRKPVAAYPASRSQWGSTFTPSGSL